MHHQHIFYKFKPEQFLDIVEWGKEKAYMTRVDVLDLNVSAARQSTNLSIEDFLRIREASHFKHDVVIHRRGYEEWKEKEYFETNWCIEIGSCSDHHYLFIYVNEEHLEEMVNQFQLAPR